MRRHPLVPFPTGWFCIGRSEDLPAGGVRPLRCLGRDLVLFRTESGRPQVLDAHCPHRGTHLGVGGQVRGEALQCPAHGRRFDTSGRCGASPLRVVGSAGGGPSPCAEQGPRAWPTCELSGLVFLYYHPRRRTPEWDLAAVWEYLRPDHRPEEWTPPRWQERRVRAHPQVICEDSVDNQHFIFVHGYRDCHTEARSAGPVLSARTRGKIDLARGGLFPTETWVDIESHVNNYGLGCTAYRIEADLGVLRYEARLLTTMTPIDGEWLDVRYSVSVRRLPDEEMTRVVAEGTTAAMFAGVEEEIPMWENRIYLEVDPGHVDPAEGPIRCFRGWARQFNELHEEERADEVRAAL